MQSDGVLVGEIAHIKAALPGGARFDDAMSNEERRAESNLILMCAVHHIKIDAKRNMWSVEKLEILKAAHEAIYTGAIDRLRDAVEDTTDGVTWRPCKTLAAIYGDEDRTNELPYDIEVVEEFAKRLAGIPLGARSVLAIAVHKGKSVKGSSGRGEIEIIHSLLEASCHCTSSQLAKNLEILEDQRLLWRDEPDFGQPATVYVGNSTGETGWKLIRDIKDASRGESDLIRRVINDLDFSALDEQEGATR